MLDYTTTPYYQKWIKKDWFFYFKLLAAVNIIHIGLLLFGLKRVQKVLGRGLNRSKIDCEIPDEESMILFSSHVKNEIKILLSFRIIVA